MIDQLFIAFIDFVKKQALAVAILICAVGGLIWFAKHQEGQFDVKLGVSDAKHEKALLFCSEKHEKDAQKITDLLVDVAIMKERVNILSGFGPDRPASKRRRN